ncbi:MAG: tripartite tricarboxylate transporter permease, partial [Pseudomonadota bacterium]
GLLIHGIFPGSDLFDNYPEVAWTFINSMLIGQLLMVAFGIYTAVWAARIARAPVPILAAAVLVLSVFGAYSVQQSMGDVLVMFSLGAMMFALVRFGFSAAPLVLGLILGPIAEANFIQGSMIANATDGPMSYFFGGVLNLVLIALVIASVLYSFVSNRKMASQPRDPSGASRAEHSVSSLVVLAVAATVCWLSFTVEPADAFLFPRLIAVFFLAFAGWNAFRALSGRARVGDGVSLDMLWKILPGLIVAVAFVYVAAKALGFYLAGTLAFFAVYTAYDPSPWGSAQAWIRRVLVTACFMGVMYALFMLLLQVQTPRGIFL